MALGFRKSLFGYNCDEVSDYLQKQAVKNTEIQTELNSKIKANLEKIDECESKINELNTLNSELSEKIEFYREKYEEVKELSDNIGKLYLVAQTNAKAIMNAADVAKTTAKGEVQQNINAINNANESLNSLKMQILEICNNFAGDIDNLNLTLAQTKAILENADSEQNQSAKNFEKFYSSLKK